MFEKELNICIKMDLALNNLQRLVWHKTKTTNQQIYLSIYLSITVCSYLYIYLYIYIYVYISIYFSLYLPIWINRESPWCNLNVLDCDIVVSDFELQTHYHVHFRTNTLRKGWTSYLLNNGLNRTTTILLHE